MEPEDRNWSNSSLFYTESCDLLTSTLAISGSGNIASTINLSGGSDGSGGHVDGGVQIFDPTSPFGSTAVFDHHRRYRGHYGSTNVGISLGGNSGGFGVGGGVGIYECRSEQLDASTNISDTELDTIGLRHKRYAGSGGPPVRVSSLRDQFRRRQAMTVSDADHEYLTRRASEKGPSRRKSPTKPNTLRIW